MLEFGDMTFKTMGFRWEGGLRSAHLDALSILYCTHIYSICIHLYTYVHVRTCIYIM